MTINDITLGQIALIVAFIVALMKGIEYLIEKLPSTRLSKDTKDLHKDVEDLKDRMNDSEEDRKDIHEALYVLLISSEALLKHEINGNDISGMKKANEEIERYLNSKIK